MKRTLTRFFSAYLIVAMAFLGMTQSVQAAMIGSEQAMVSSATAERERVLSFLERSDVAAKLETFGIMAQDARVRVAAMSDNEVAGLAKNIDEAPAGGIIGAILLILLVLLVTDILGFTKIFPFTRTAK